MTLTFEDVPIKAQYPRDFIKAATPTLVAGRRHSLFYLAGIPPAAAAPSPGIGGAVLTAYAGQLPFDDAGSGLETRLSRFQGQATQPGTLILADRLWHNSGITITSTAEQTFTGAAEIPARDENGLALGHGVFAAVEVYAATGAGTPTLTLKYTNQDGTADKTATNIYATVASSAIGAMYPIGLAAGDGGVRKAQSLTLSATWTSGSIGVVLYRQLARLELTSAGVPNAVDMLTSGLPYIYNDSVLYLIFVPSTTTATNICGHAIWAQG